MLDVNYKKVNLEVVAQNQTQLTVIQKDLLYN